MSLSPKVSVIVPVFNAGEKLGPTIESLLDQSLRELEIIIVNDASTDDTASVISQLAENNNNIVPVYFAQNQGVHEARLAGLKKSSAPWIGFLDADDFAGPKMYETMLYAAESNDVDIVVCGSHRVTPRRKVIGPKLRFPRSAKVTADVFERFCKFDFGTGMLWNKLFKRSIIEPCFALHFPWRQSINEDLLLNIGCFYRAASVFLLRDVLHEYVLADTSVTTRMKNSWAYVETLRAYVLAVICYQHLGSQPLSQIIEMYRTQISWDNYKVLCTTELTEYKAELEEAVNVLCRENPYALSAIVARQQSQTVGAKLALKSLHFAVMKRLKEFFYRHKG